MLLSLIQSIPLCVCMRACVCVCVCESDLYLSFLRISEGKHQPSLLQWGLVGPSVASSVIHSVNTKVIVKLQQTNQIMLEED